MKTTQLRQLALTGAKHRLEELKAEEVNLRQMFPELGKEPRNGIAAPRSRKRRKVSAAERKAISQRMKAYWAARKKTSK